MTQKSDLTTSANPRIYMFSQQHLQKLVSRCVNYEFEDVICEIDDIELLIPEPNRLFEISHKIWNQLAKQLPLTFFYPGIKKTQLTRDYDLFVAICMFPRDLLAINAVKGWKDHCRTSVCLLNEIWANKLHQWKGHLKYLSKFDYVILNCGASVQNVHNIIKKPCFYLPPGIDTIRFCPYPNPPVRSIDVFNLGRKSQVTHKSLLKMAEQNNFFYIYDTLEKMETFHRKQHRNLIATLAKRSRYFLASAAKINMPLETSGQYEIGFRFFEGAASGTVMIGEPPENEAFRNNFDWPDAVIKVPFHSPNIAEVLAELDSQPQRLEKIRKNSIIQSLLRHDWVYRWRAILDIVGLKPRPALIAREERLKKLAEDVTKA